MNRCILGEINEKTYILAKSPKVHKGGGSTPQPIGGYVGLYQKVVSRIGDLNASKLGKWHTQEQGYFQNLQQDPMIVSFHLLKSQVGLRKRTFRVLAGR